MPLLGIFSKQKRQSRDVHTTVSGNSEYGTYSQTSLSDPSRSLPPPRLVSSSQASSSKTRLPVPKKSPNGSNQTTNYDSSRPPRLALSFLSSESISDLPSPFLNLSQRVDSFDSSQSFASTPSLSPVQATSSPLGESLPRSSFSSQASDISESTTPRASKKNRSGGLFSWSKNHIKLSNKSDGHLPRPKKSKAVSPMDSFSLKSFRHVGGYQFDGSVAPPPSSSSSSHAHSRTRGESGDSAQRISVAAFREVQARRSTVESPLPSENASFSSPPSSNASPSPRARPGHPQRPTSRVIMTNSRSTLSSSTTSEEEDSDSDSYGEDEDEDTLTRDRTITRRTARFPSKSEGHGMHDSPKHVGRPRSNSNQGRPPTVRFSNPPVSGNSAAEGSRARSVFKSASETPDGVYNQPRASFSTGASSGSPGAKRASPMAAGGANSSQQAGPSKKPTPPDSDSDTDSDASDSDTPLATLATKRPGSSMSHSSNATARSRIPVRPLIDINELTAGKREEGFTKTSSETSVLLSPVRSSSPESMRSTPPRPPRSAPPSQTRSTTPASQHQPSPLSKGVESASSVATPPPSPLRSVTAEGSPRASRVGSESYSDADVPTTPTRRDFLSPTNINERLARAAAAAASPRSSQQNLSLPIASPSPSRVSEQKFPRGAANASSSPRAGSLPLVSAASAHKGEQDLDRLASPRRSHRRSLSHGSGLDAITPGGLPAIPASGPEDEGSGAATPSSNDEWEIVKKEPEGFTRIVPTPIRQRTPPPAFSVTSRPPRPTSSSSIATSRPQSVVVSDSLHPQTALSSSRPRSRSPLSSADNTPPRSTPALPLERRPPEFEINRHSGTPSPPVPSPRMAGNEARKAHTRSTNSSFDSANTETKPAPLRNGILGESRPRTNSESSVRDMQGAQSSLLDSSSHETRGSRPRNVSDSSIRDKPGAQSRNSILVLDSTSKETRSALQRTRILLPDTTSSGARNAQQRHSIVSSESASNGARNAQQRHSVVSSDSASNGARNAQQHHGVFSSEPATSGARNAQQRNNALLPDSASSVTNSGVQTKQRNSTASPLATPFPAKRDVAASKVPSKSQPLGRSSPLPPGKPFANARRESPSSSTGDSSSGRVPLTPVSGSDYGGGVAETKKNGHTKKPSVPFEDSRGRSREPAKGDPRVRDGADGSAQDVNLANEQRRKERRRSEAKAAIDLGNVINGPGPVIDDDEEEVASGDHLSMMNSMMNGYGYAAPTSGQGWNPWQRQSFVMPQGMVPDPNFLAAHRQAMMYAKQAYQMAVAQQAIAAAGEEWERTSNVSGMSGMNMFGAAQNPYAMGLPTVQGLGMMNGVQGGWAGQPMMMPQMYGFGSTQSDVGHIRRGGNAGMWDTMSTYGGSLGPSGVPGDRTSMVHGGPGPGQPRRQRDSFYGAQPPQMQGGVQAPSTHSRASGSGTGGAARQRQRTGSVPTPSNTGAPSGAPSGRRAPPTSWKPLNV